jgi:nucleoside-diphosphate kinase
MERTFVMLKPGILQRRLVGELIQRFEQKGLKIIALKIMHIDKSMAEIHYAEHRGKGFYEELAAYIVSGPVIAMILEAQEAISLVRRLIGSTNIHDALPGTIRGDFAAQTTLNIVHASDSKVSAEREMALFFKPEEIYDWEDGNAQWF